MSHETWKSPLPVTSPEQARTWSSLSQWLRVPWTKTFQVNYNGTTSSGTAAAMPTPSITMPITKLRDNTQLSCVVHGSFYCTTNPAICYIYVIVDGGTAYGAGFQYTNVSTSHTPVVGAVDITDVAAGAHTLTIGWARGSNTITTNADDQWELVVTEINGPPST